MNPETFSPVEYDYDAELMEQVEAFGADSLTDEERQYLGMERAPAAHEYTPIEEGAGHEANGERSPEEVTSPEHTQSVLEGFAKRHGTTSYEKGQLLYRHDRLVDGRLLDASGTNITALIEGMPGGSDSSAAIRAHYDLLQHFDRNPSTPFKQDDWFDAGGRLNRTFVFCDADGWISYWSVVTDVERPSLIDQTSMDTESNLSEIGASESSTETSPDEQVDGSLVSGLGRSLLDAFFKERSGASFQERSQTERSKEERSAHSATVANDVTPTAGDEEPALVPKARSLNGVTLRRAA